MLVLSRKERQSIQIGDAITLTVIRISGGQVRLSFDAPEEVTILRTELTPRPEMSEPKRPLMEEVAA